MSQSFSFSNLNEIIKKFPETSDTLIVDCYLSDSEHYSSRLFRLYRDLPMHYHSKCDEVLLLYKGKADFYIGNDPPRRIEAGSFVTFFKNTRHGLKIIGDEPVIILSCDTPRRSPDDITYCHPEETEGLKFVSHVEKD